MGYASVGRKSQPQIQRHIRAVARDSLNVILTSHAKAQMRSRKVLHAEVIACLRSGCIHRPPEPNPAKGNLEVRMEYYVAGRDIKVIVAVSDEDPDLLVVTVIA
jgi:hypothetical protein